MSTVFPEVLRLAAMDHFTLRRTHAIDTIILHATGGRDSLNWLRLTSSPPVSCHILVTKGGQRYRLVSDSSEAWHAGRGLLQVSDGPRVNINRRSLGIEMENMNDGRDPYPEEQLETTAHQIAAWSLEYPGVRLYRHTDVDRSKSDPRGLDYAAFVRRVYRHVCGMLGK